MHKNRQEQQQKCIDNPRKGGDSVFNAVKLILCTIKFYDKYYATLFLLFIFIFSLFFFFLGKSVGMSRADRKLNEMNPVTGDGLAGGWGGGGGGVMVKKNAV